MKKLQAQAKNFCRVLDIRVSQIVDSDNLHTGHFASVFHTTLQFVFRQRENPRIPVQTVELPEIILHFLTEEVRHLNDPVAFLGFRCGNHIFAADPLIGFVDPERFLLEIEVCGSQCQQFAFSDAAPVQDFKRIVQHGFVHHGVDEFQILILRPE